MKHQRKATRSRKSEVRTTAPTVSGPKSNQKHKRFNDSARPAKGKVIDSRTKVVHQEKIQQIGLRVHCTSPDKIKALEAIRDEMPGNSGRTQEKRSLAALAKFSLSTFEASRHLDVYDPRARIMGLRNKGHNILTSWAMVHTECGRLHRVGIYTLHRGGVAPPAGNRQPSLFTDDAFAEAEAGDAV